MEKMKKITKHQWQKMSPKKRSWIVVKTIGEKARIYWHCVDPNGVKLGGSMLSKAACDCMIETARGLTKKEAAKIPCEFPHPFAACTAKPSTAYPHYAEFEHLALGLIPRIVEKHATIRIFETPFGITCQCAGMDATTDSYTESLCLLFLRLEKVITDDDES